MTRLPASDARSADRARSAEDLARTLELDKGPGLVMRRDGAGGRESHRFEQRIEQRRKQRVLSAGPA